jgi:hypothetical protein
VVKIFIFQIHSTSPTSLPTVDDAAVQRAVEEVAAAVAHQESEPQLSHARAHDFGHGEAVSRQPEFFLETFSTSILLFSTEFFSSSPDLWTEWT